MDKEKVNQGVLFDDKFLDKYAGPIICDAAVAIVELVADAWDAYATRVDIIWPKRSQNIAFSITDNGRGHDAGAIRASLENPRLQSPCRRGEQVGAAIGSSRLSSSDP